MEYKTLNGEHCETSAIGTLLSYIGIELSEPMIFGIGEGLGFGVINFGKIPFPFIGGRIKTGLITQRVCENLNLVLVSERTTSKKKAWQNIQNYLDKGQPVGLQLDSYYLDYFTSRVHFAGHFVAALSYDADEMVLSDTSAQGGVMSCKRTSVEAARGYKGPMSDKHYSFTIECGETYHLKDVVKMSIKNNAEDFLNPPIKNFGYKGIYKMADELSKWFHNSENPYEDFSTMAMLMEKAGTGGAVFRNIYRDFLKEAYQLLDSEVLKEAYLMYAEVASMWSEVIKQLADIKEDQLEEIADQLRKIADIEYRCMTMLLVIDQ